MIFTLNPKIEVWYKFILYTLCGCMDYALFMYTKSLTLNRQAYERNN